MNSLSQEFWCYLKDTKSGYKNFFAASNEPKGSKSILSVQTPLKRKTIEKYFLKEKDIETIKESLLEEPKIFQFDKVFNSEKHSLMVAELNSLVSETISTRNSLVVVLLGTHKLFETYFGSSSELPFVIFDRGQQQSPTRRHSKETEAPVSLHASIMVEDLQADLFDANICETIHQNYQEVSNLGEMKILIDLLNKNLEKMKSKFNVNFIDKITHTSLSFKTKFSEISFLIFPTFESGCFEKKDKFKEWTAFKSYMTGTETVESLEKRYFFLDFLKARVHGSRMLTILETDSSPHSFENNARVLEEVSELRETLALPTFNSASFRMNLDMTRKRRVGSDGLSGQKASGTLGDLTNSHGDDNSRYGGEFNQRAVAPGKPPFYQKVNNSEQSQIQSYANNLISEVNSFLVDAQDFLESRKEPSSYQHRELQGIHPSNDPTQDYEAVKTRIIELNSQLVETQKLTNDQISIQRLSRAQQRLRDLAERVELSQKRENLTKRRFKKVNQPGSLREMGLNRPGLFDPNFGNNLPQGSAENRFHQPGGSEYLYDHGTTESHRRQVSLASQNNNSEFTNFDENGYSGRIQGPSSVRLGKRELPDPQRLYQNPNNPNILGPKQYPHPFKSNSMVDNFGNIMTKPARKRDYLSANKSGGGLNHRNQYSDLGAQGYSTIDEGVDVKDSIDSRNQLKHQRNMVNVSFSPTKSQGNILHHMDAINDSFGAKHPKSSNNLLTNIDHAASGKKGARKTPRKRNSLKNNFKPMLKNRRKFSSQINRHQIQQELENSRARIRSLYASSSDSNHSSSSENSSSDSSDESLAARRSVKDLKAMSKKLTKKLKSNVAKSNGLRMQSEKRVQNETKKLKKIIKKLTKELKLKHMEIKKHKDTEYKLKLTNASLKNQLENQASNKVENSEKVKSLKQKVDDLSDLLNSERQSKLEKKQKWTLQKKAFTIQIDNLKAELNEVKSEKLIYEKQFDLASKNNIDQGEKTNILKNELEQLKSELEDVQTQAIEMQDEMTQKDNRILELEMTLEIQRAKNGEVLKKLEDMQNESEMLKDNLNDLQKSMEEKAIMLSDKKNREIMELNQELDEMRGELEEGKVQENELGKLVDGLKAKLHAAEALVTEGKDLALELDETRRRGYEVEVKVKDLEEVLRDKTEKNNALDKENGILKVKLGSLGEQVDTLKHEIETKDDKLQEMENEYQILEMEKEDLKKKTEMLVKKQYSMDTFQQEQLEMLEKRVEATVHELHQIRLENEQLNQENSNLKNKTEELDERVSDFKTKYKAKKTENGVLREKCSKLASELTRLEMCHQDNINFISERKNKEMDKQRKLKTLGDLKSMIGQYRDKTTTLRYY